MQIRPTKTMFCHDIWQLESEIQLVSRQDDQTYIVVRETPFHPVSHIWPDHPADKGTISFGEHEYCVADCQVGAVEHESGTLYVGKAIPVKRDTDGWSFVVVHCLSGSEADLNVGNVVCLNVDKEYQQSLSRGHSAGHIAFLALNKVLAQSYWRKDADRKDPLGNFDFNSYAQETSFVTPDRCDDVYRLGKTLKKRGLNTAEVFTELADIEVKVNQQIGEWLSTESMVSMRLEGESLTDSRYWQWQLPGHDLAVIPCGGSHISSTSELGSICVSLIQRDAQNIEMHTHVKTI